MLQARALPSNPLRPCLPPTHPPPAPQEAYELILGKRAGKEVEGRPASQSGWSFHDWYWSFSMKRRKGPMAAAAAAADPPPAAQRSQWQAQVAGLKHKAQAKAGRLRQRRPHAAAAAPEAAASMGGPSSSPAGRERVWRSMTKNARNADKAAADQAAAQKLGGAGAATPVAAVGTGPALRQQPQQTHVQPQPQQHAAEQQAGTAQHQPEPQHGSSPSHRERLQRLMHHAAQVVRQHSAATGIADAAESAAGAVRRHLRGRLSLEQLSSLLSGQSAQHHSADGATAGNAVAADQTLHQRFEAHMRRRQHAQHAPQEPAAAEQGPPLEEAHADLGHHAPAEEQGHASYPPLRAHDRKFADRGHVEERLNTQLTGLKRRAALKQEVRSSC